MLATTNVPSLALEQTLPPPVFQPLPAPSQVALLGKGEVEDVVWSPDHKTFAVVSSPGIYLYDGQTRKQIKFIPYASTYSPQFSPDGRLLAVTGMQGRQLIDLSTGQVILGKDTDPKMDGYTIFSPDGTTLVVQIFGGDGVDIYDLKTLARTHEIRGSARQEHNFLDAKISPDSRWLAVADRALHQIILWDLQKGAEQFVINQHTGLPLSVNFSPDSSVLVSAGEDESIRFWSVPDGRLLRTITGVAGGVYRLSFASDGKHLRLDYGSDYTRLLDAQTGQQIQVIYEDNVAPATDPAYDFLGLDGFQWGDPAFSPDGKSLAVIRHQNAVIWDLAGQRPNRIIRLDDIPYYLVNYGFSHAGGSLALEKDETQARKLSLTTEAILKAYDENHQTIAAISPDGKALAIGGKEAVELWDLTTQTRLWKLSTPLDWITELYFSPSGDTLTAIAAGRSDTASQKRAHLIDVSTGTDQNQLELFPDTGDSRHIAVNGRWIATALEDSQVVLPPVRVLDLATGKPLSPLEGLEQVKISGIRDFRFSPDGRLLALLRYDNLSIWSTATGKLLFDHAPTADGCPSAEIRFNHLAFSPDTGTLAISYENQQVAIWDIRSLRESAPPLTDDLIKSLPPAPTPTPTPAIPPDVLRYQCLTIASDTSSWSLPADKLLLQGRTGYGRPVLLNLKDGTQQDLQADRERISNTTTSPDGKWLTLNLYDLKTRAHRLEIRPSDPSHGRVYSYTLQNHSMLGWLDNQHIILRGAGKIFTATIILNPFTGVQAPFYLEDLPNYPMTMSAMGVYFSSSNLMPDPSLNMVVFPQYQSKGDESGNFIVLWDRRTNTAVAEIREGAFGHDPLWAVNGEDFLVPVMVQSSKKDFSYEWFQVTRTGQVHQLTHFGNFPNGTFIDYATRSPDGNRVAFSLSGQLAVLDVQTQQTTSYCLPGPEWPTPIWSPDGRYLAYSFFYADNGSKVVLIDTVDNKAAYILDDASAAGWLVGH